MAYNRYSEFIKWVGIQTKINESFTDGSGHFFPRRSVVNVHFGENIGYEKSKIRPCLVISNDTNNRRSGNIVVVPLTKVSNKKRNGNNKVKLLPSQYLLYKSKYKFLAYDSIVQCEDIRVVSKARVGDVIGFIHDKKIDMKNIEKRLKYYLAL